MTPIGMVDPSSRSVFSSNVVLPAPGELIRLIARIPFSRNQILFFAASTSFLARTCRSSAIVRTGTEPAAGSGFSRTPSASEHPHVPHMVNPHPLP